MNNLSNRVGIIGGGIAGLTHGCTLLKEGIPAVIFEQSSEEKSHGAAISLSQNALRLLDRINIFSNFIVSSLTDTPIRILDKNFGILFGFFRALLIFSLLNILLYWTLWKRNIPQWLNNSKSMVLINYTSDKLIQLLPSNSLKSIEQLFNISLDNGVKKFINKEKQIDKYNEPVINLRKDNNQKGYSESDNDSLDKLFNIESNN